jgi:glycosyltransferase involved in cell wall biosynthesis
LKGKKILFVLGSFGLGGAERQALLLGEFLKKEMKTHVEFWAMSGPGPASTLLDQNNIPWKTIDSRFQTKKDRKSRLLGLLKILLELKRYKPDVILPYTFYPNVTACLLWRFSTAKACVWNQRDLGVHFQKGRFTILASKLASHFVSNSQAGATFLEEELGIKREKVKIIHNGVLEKNHYPIIPNDKQFRRPKGVEYVGIMLGNLHKSKDHLTLLIAWKIICSKFKEDERPLLVLAGKNHFPDGYFEELVKSYGLSSNVILLGSVLNIFDTLTQADFGILSSKKEGCPNAVLEYMKAGLPVVATRNDGTEEVLGKDYPLLAEKKNPEALADKILFLIQNNEDRNRIIKQNTSRVESFYSIERMTQEYQLLLKSIFQK